jgi:hypothetical protein
MVYLSSNYLRVWLWPLEGSKTTKIREKTCSKMVRIGPKIL